MSAINKTTTQVKENVNVMDTASKVTISLFGGTSVLIGLWSVASLVAAVIGNGPLGLFKAYFSAVTGM